MKIFSHNNGFVVANEIITANITHNPLEKTYFMDIGFKNKTEFRFSFESKEEAIKGLTELQLLMRSCNENL